MNRQERGRSERLESILERHVGYERRTLADLHTAGWRFRTIAQAQRHLEFQRLLPGWNPDQIKSAIKAAEMTEGHR